jgi:hypothetical protein
VELWKEKNFFRQKNMDLPENADLLEALRIIQCDFNHLPNIRETNDWYLVQGLTIQQLARIKNIRCGSNTSQAVAPG